MSPPLRLNSTPTHALHLFPLPRPPPSSPPSRHRHLRSPSVRVPGRGLLAGRHVEVHDLRKARCGERPWGGGEGRDEGPLGGVKGHPNPYMKPWRTRIWGIGQRFGGGGSWCSGTQTVRGSRQVGGRRVGGGAMGGGNDTLTDTVRNLKRGMGRGPAGWGVGSLV